MELRDMIRDARKERGWTQPELAANAGVSVSMVQNTESGRTSPQGPNLRKMLQSLGLEQEAAEAEQAEDWRAALPSDVGLFLDVLAIYLLELDEAERHDWMLSVHQQIIQRPQ